MSYLGNIWAGDGHIWAGMRKRGRCVGAYGAQAADGGNEKIAYICRICRGGRKRLKTKAIGARQMAKTICRDLSHLSRAGDGGQRGWGKQAGGQGGRGARP